MKTKEEILDSKICTLEYGHYTYSTVIDAMSEVEQQTREEMYLNMQYYHEYCIFKGYVTPQEWIEKHKHF